MTSSKSKIPIFQNFHQELHVGVNKHGQNIQCERFLQSSPSCLVGESSSCAYFKDIRRQIVPTWCTQLLVSPPMMELHLDSISLDPVDVTRVLQQQSRLNNSSFRITIYCQRVSCLCEVTDRPIALCTLDPFAGIVSHHFSKELKFTSNMVVFALVRRRYKHVTTTTTSSAATAVSQHQKRNNSDDSNKKKQPRRRQRDDDDDDDDAPAAGAGEANTKTKTQTTTTTNEQEEEKMLNPTTVRINLSGQLVLWVIEADFKEAMSRIERLRPTFPASEHPLGAAGAPPMAGDDYTAVLKAIHRDPTRKEPSFHRLRSGARSSVESSAMFSSSSSSSAGDSSSSSSLSTSPFRRYDRRSVRHDDSSSSSPSSSQSSGSSSDDYDDDASYNEAFDNDAASSYDDDDDDDLHSDDSASTSSSLMSSVDDDDFDDDEEEYDDEEEDDDWDDDDDEY